MMMDNVSFKRTKVIRWMMIISTALLILIIVGKKVYEHTYVASKYKNELRAKLKDVSTRIKLNDAQIDLCTECIYKKYIDFYKRPNYLPAMDNFSRNDVYIMYTCISKNLYDTYEQTKMINKVDSLLREYYKHY